MTVAALAAKLSERIDASGLEVSPVERARLLAYLELASRWNRRMNLTAFDLGSPTAEAIDRLVIEPLRGAALVGGDARVGLDVGSGGGSPAVPLAIRCPAVVMTMVESRQRKASFLREVVREVGLSARVVDRRLEDVPDDLVPPASVDVVSIRAVRVDALLVRDLAYRMKRSARVIIFGHATDSGVLELERAYSAGVSSIGLFRLKD